MRDISYKEVWLTLPNSTFTALGHYVMAKKTVRALQARNGEQTFGNLPKKKLEFFN